MATVKSSERQRESVSASELAQMGVCELLVVFEHQYGKRRTAEQQRAATRGLRAHMRFYRERQGDSARQGRCFGAALVFESQVLGTMLLRCFGYRVSRLWRAWHSLIRCLVRWRQAAESRNGP